MTPVETVCKHLPAPELLAQLAEEATELAQAALKLRRAMDGTNPTPKTLEECKGAMLEELADVNACLTALDFSLDLEWENIGGLIGRKMARWAKRLEGEK